MRKVSRVSVELDRYRILLSSCVENRDVNGSKARRELQRGKNKRDVQ